MQVNISRLRYWFAAATLAAILIVAGFYFYARYRFYHAVKEIPQKLGVEVQQSTESFSLSKSEGGRTLFTIRASKAVQFKEGGRAELKNVSILVYGRDSDRFDQIYGSDFEYDPRTGNVVAKGEVQIDLEANAVGQIAPNQAPPPELKNPIHVKTSGLVFNQKSGIAKTEQTVEFRIPQAAGSALGAIYDSKSNTLTLTSDVKLDTTGEDAASIRARRGVLTKEPRQAVLQGVQATRGESSLAANTLTVVLRQDNAIDHMFADGNVQISATGQTNLAASAPHAEVVMTGKNLLQSAVMRGGVAIKTTGAHAVTGTAGRVTLQFGPASQLTKVRASEGVRLLQQASSVQSGSTSATLVPVRGNPQMVNAALGSSTPVRTSAPSRKSSAAQDNIELITDAIDFYVRNGKQLERAETSGSARIAIVPTQGGATQQTTITADKFTAGFDRNRLNAIHGAPNARVVQSSQQSERVTTSDMLDATFAPDGSISGFVQQGNFEYREGAPGTKNTRTATGQKATFNNLTQLLTLEGSPRVVEGGMTVTAQLVRLNRRNGEAEAERDVKTTYSELKPQTNGAMLASGDPVHVTAAKMTASSSSGVARYSGDARLWQGANVVQAPIIVFDRDRRSLQAEGTARQQVSTALVQEGKDGTVTPVSITAARLTYQDKQRRARFEGGVLVRSADGIMTADHLDVFLKAAQPSAIAANRNTPATVTGAAPSQLEKIVAEGHVVVQQPTRRANGNTLVYTSETGKFVLTGGPPTIVDAERGTITGASLTFYSRDDRVLVEGGDQGRTVTNTRVSK